MNNYIKVVLKSGKDQSVFRRHPWVFSGAIKKMYGSPEEGDIVAVYDNKDTFMALGHYQVGSIAIRIISFEDVVIDEQFWYQRIEQAYNYRLSLGLIDNPQTNVYRLIYAEGDLLPGFIADYYNGTIVFQMHSIGMYQQRHIFVEALKKLYGSSLKAIYDKSSTTIPFKSETEAKDDYLFGSPENTEVLENGFKFKIDWVRGQKTGFFIDQRENRKLVGELSKDKKVLNVFGYTGGFSVYAMGGGAKQVDSVDSSAHAIDMTIENMSLNFGESNHRGICTDAFKFLEEMDDDYDVIILDPPAFAKHQNVLHNALQGYKKLNQKAFTKIKKGGFLLTYSCSQVVSKENFRKSVFVGAANSGREVKLIRQLGHPMDHPVNLYHPEGEYLKGLLLYVE